MQEGAAVHCGYDVKLQVHGHGEHTGTAWRNKKRYNSPITPFQNIPGWVEPVVSIRPAFRIKAIQGNIK